jgi:hypothetical protein
VCYNDFSNNPNKNPEEFKTYQEQYIEQIELFQKHMSQLDWDPSSPLESRESFMARFSSSPLTQYIYDCFASDRRLCRFIVMGMLNREPEARPNIHDVVRVFTEQHPEARSIA